MTSSIKPLERLSRDVSANADAAAVFVCSLDSFQRIAAQPSGLMTEYQANLNIATRSPTPMPSAPPDPPSPITTQTIGVRSRLISRRLTAMASAWPRSSAFKPGYAPGVSMSVKIGKPNFSASFIF